MLYLLKNQVKMENVFITNGSTQLILIPKNELEISMLKILAEQGPLEIEFVTSAVAIVDKSAKNTLIIKKKKNDPVQT